MRRAYSRALLKLSGEALAGEKGYGLDYKVVETFADELKTVHTRGVQLSLVVGGGNILRGTSASREGLDRVSADYMGMLATVINALAMQSALENREIKTRLQTAIVMEQIAEPFIRRRAVRHLEKGRVVIFGAGTGNPYFTTDTAAALRAIEIEADALIMGKNGVDGIYNADPRTNPEAQRYDRVTYREVHERNLRVMDLTAITLCQENRLPILVFNMSQPGNLKRLVMGEHIGTVVTAEA